MPIKARRSTKNKKALLSVSMSLSHLPLLAFKQNQNSARLNLSHVHKTLHSKLSLLFHSRGAFYSLQTCRTPLAKNFGSLYIPSVHLAYFQARQAYLRLCVSRQLLNTSFAWPVSLTLFHSCNLFNNRNQALHNQLKTVSTHISSTTFRTAHQTKTAYHNSATFLRFALHIQFL